MPRRLIRLLLPPLRETEAATAWQTWSDTLAQSQPLPAGLTLQVFSVGTRLLQNFPRPHQLQPSGSPLKSPQEKFLGEFIVKFLALSFLAVKSKREM